MSSVPIEGNPLRAIFSRARTAFKKAESVHLSGGGSSGGGTFEIDMRYAADGKAVGTISSSGQPIEPRRIGKVIYLTADRAFWQQTGGAQAAALPGGKFLRAPLTDQRVAQLAAFTDKDEFVDEVLDVDGTITKGEAKDVRGTPAVGLVNEATSGGGTLYVATTGEPLPLQLLPEAGSADSGTLDFLEYGDPVDVPVPPAARTVDVTALGGN